MEIRGSVGRNAENSSGDVLLVQRLLAQSASLLIPARDDPPTGICTAQTVMLIELFQSRVLAMTAPSGRVEPRSQTWYALNRQCGDDTAILHQALLDLESEAVNFAQRFIKDDTVRANYVARAKTYSEDILQRVKDGRLSPKAAAAEANEMRNGLLEAARLKSSDIGRAVAEAEKATGLTMEQLMAKYSNRLFQREFDALTAAEKDAVFIEIARAAGRPNPKFTGLASRLGKAGIGLLVVSLAIGAYSVATSDRPGREAARQGTGLLAGFLGSVGGGAAAGLACGPGAPVCVAVGAFVGGLVFTVGADITFEWLWN